MATLTRKKERSRGQIITKGIDRHLIRVYLGSRAGKRKYASRIFRGTYSSAKRELTKALREVDTKSYVEPSRQTLGEYLTNWLNAFASVAVSERTLEDYRHRLTHDVIPVVGHKRLDQVHLADIQGLYASLQSKHSPRTIRYTHSILKQALRRAVISNILIRNPADHVELPREVRREIKVLNPSEVSLLLEVTRDTPLYPLWAVLLLGGLRPGEALGLKWSDLDSGQLRIQRALKKRAGDRYYLADTKTDRSRRLIPLPAVATRALEAHKIQQKREILAAGPAYERNDLVFANSIGRPMDIAKIRRCFKSVLREAGLPSVRLYDARHTHATVLMLEGVNPKVVSERLGHTNIGITLDTYSHVLPTMQQAAVEKLEKLFAVGGI